MQIIASMQGQLEKLKTALAAIDQTCTEAHRLRDLQDEERDQLVLAELRKLAVVPGETTNGSLPSQLPSQPAPPTSSNAEIAAIQAQMATMQADHAAAQQPRQQRRQNSK